MAAFDPLAFIERHRWTFAKTYAGFAPHAYVVRDKCGDEEGFISFVRFIRRFGRPRIWRRKVYICWYAPDGKRYWTMGWPVAETTIINQGFPDSDDTRAPEQGERLRYSSPRGFQPEGYLP